MFSVQLTGFPGEIYRIQRKFAVPFKIGTCPYLGSENPIGGGGDSKNLKRNAKKNWYPRKENYIQYIHVDTADNSRGLGQITPKRGWSGFVYVSNIKKNVNKMRDTKHLK